MEIERATTSLPDRSLEPQIRRLGPWFHNLHLPGGAQTAPEHPLGDFPRYKWLEIAAWLPEDLGSWRALDIGCNAGYYSFELARRGAEVVGIDIDPHYLGQARWARRLLGLERRVRFERRGVYELPLLAGCFDVVLFMGVFYHLRHPLLALEMAAEKTERFLVFQTLSLPGEEVAENTRGLGLGDRRALLSPGWPRMAFVEHDLADDPTNWWVPSHACCEAMLRSVGLRVVARPGTEIYCCAPAGPRRRQPFRDELGAYLEDRR
jgi:tRNA (mo5U34)-methyltransferase